jgi:flagellar motor switch protein FliN/FliY
MDEQKQTPEEFDAPLNVPPEFTGEEASTASAIPEPQMPEMDFAQEIAKPPQQSESPDMDESDAEAMMLKMMEESAGIKQVDPIVAPPSANQPVVERAAFEQLRGDAKGASKNIDMLLDVSLPISIELGRTALKIEDILNLGPGSVVELDKLAGEPVDILVNDRLLAKGEVVVIDENFGVRITAMVSPQDRIRSLK